MQIFTAMFYTMLYSWLNSSRKATPGWEIFERHYKAFFSNYLQWCNLCIVATKPTRLQKSNVLVSEVLLHQIQSCNLRKINLSLPLSFEYIVCRIFLHDTAVPMSNWFPSSKKMLSLQSYLKILRIFKPHNWLVAGNESDPCKKCFHL